jgi:hypothetical protein
LRLHSFPGGYEQRSLGLFDPVLERLQAPGDFGAIGTDTDAGYWQVHYVDAKNPNALFEYRYRARESRPQDLLPPIAIYGDSFADHLVAARLQEEFSTVYRAQRPGHIPEGVRYLLVVFNEAVIWRFGSSDFLKCA